MADNTILNTGTGGDTIATDDIAGIKHQRVKVQHGADGSATDVSAASPLPVDASGVAVPVTDNGGSITVDGTVAVTGVATAANQLPDGHAVTVDNASGAAAVNIQDGGNSITVDNGGTFAVQATLGAETTKIIGTVNIAAAQSVAVTNAGTFATQIDGDALTALQTIDNPVFADDAAFTLASSSVMMSGAIRDDSLTTLTAVEGDAVPLRVGSTGALHVTGGGGGTEYSEDVATPATIVGTATMMERDDALSTLTPIEGDWAGMRCDSQGALWVNAVNAGGTSNIDSVAGATDEGAVMLAVRDDSLTTLTPADGDYVPLRTNSTGALHVTGGGGGTEYTVDGAAPAAPTGTASLMERDDALSTLTEVAGDWIQQRCNANGAMWTAIDGNVTEANSAAILADTANMDTNLGTIAGAVTGTEMQVDVVTSALPTGAATAANQLPDGHNVTIDNASGAAAVNIQDGGNSITVDGTVTANLGATDNAVLDDIAAHTSDPMTVAHDAAATGAANVNMAGARATNSIEGVTQVANGDATRLQADLNGVLLSRPHTTPEEHISERVSNTNGTSTAFTNFAAGGAGIHNYVTDITVYNSSATDGYVDIRDGAAGAILWTLPLPATGGATHSFSLPLKGAANTALAFDVSAALTTVYISVNGFQAQG